MAHRKVIIVGGGFGGINAAKTLSRSRHFSVTVVDRRNHHLFQPLLYQVAMAALSPAEIASPIRSILAGRNNVEVFLGEVRQVDFKRSRVITSFAELEYDYLILACGAQHSYFGHNDWENFAPGLKTLEQATEIRRRVLTAFEMAEREQDVEIKKDLLTFIVVGGGPTGVELAGALGEISRFTLAKDFAHIDPSRTRIILIEGGPRILASFSEPLSRLASRDLEFLGVTIRTNSRVTKINGEGVWIGSEHLRARTVLWAAGVEPAQLNRQLEVELDNQGRVIVAADLSLPAMTNVFVIGDQAHAKDDTGHPLPGLAPVAIQQGRHVAKMIVNDMAGQPRKPFYYRDKGQMATIGKKRAVAQIGQLEFSGYVAWILWLLIHIYYLIGFKNRVFVMLDWMWAYFTFKRGARLITDPHGQWRPESSKPI
jgi:NADH:ubiquinone reductase (H+-translocating)